MVDESGTYYPRHGGLNVPHGLASKDHIDEYYNIDINPGRLYPTWDTVI